MPNDNLSFFDEKRCVIKSKTDWGWWWQTVHEVHIEVKLPNKTSAKQIKIDVEPKFIRCIVQGNTVFEVNVKTKSFFFFQFQFLFALLKNSES